MATYETARDQFVTVDGINFAYRHLGPANGIPLVFLMHFRGTMDHWDPAFINPLAAKRPVLLIDNAGVGRSTGQVPKTFAGWALHYASAIRALGHSRVDVLGFSMGGCAAQMLALNHPDLVRRLVLCGTTPSSGPGVVTAPSLGPFEGLMGAETEEEQREAFLASFFDASEWCRREGEVVWRRITGARRGRGRRSGHVEREGARRQGIAFAKFMDPKQGGDASYGRFEELRMPVLIANGSEDVLLPSENSYLMWKMLSKHQAQLHLFPDSGHGFLFQYAHEFAGIVNDFLDAASMNQGPTSRL